VVISTEDHIVITVGGVATYTTADLTAVARGITR
jgi:hypothetical protein